MKQSTITYTATGVIAVLGAITASIVFWGSYGWPTITEWEDHVEATSGYATLANTISIGQTGFDSRITQLEEAAENLGDQLKGYIAVAQIIRDLVRAECMGANTLRGQINARKAEYMSLTGEVFVEPECEQIPQ